MEQQISLVRQCKSSEDTEYLGMQIGSVLKGGEVIELIGDVGAGKTTFVRGLARGADSPDHVSSPTFTVEQIYDGRVELHHLDLYRLGEPGLIAHQLEESMADPKNVVVMEWADTIQGSLPECRLIIKFEVSGETSRTLHLSFPQKYIYLGPTK